MCLVFGSGLRRRLWISHDSLAGAGCSEVVDGACHVIALSVALGPVHVTV
jgi:hypothetical protein